MHLLMLGSGDEARSRLGLVNRAIAVNTRAARLRLGLRPQWLRQALGVIKAAPLAIDGVTIISR
jgi:hypothetical protein